MAERAAKLWLLSALAWLCLGPTIGLLQSLQFLWPDTMAFWSDLALPYSKMRIIHTNSSILGWIVMTFIGAALYMVPRLVDQELKLAPLAWWAAWVWNLAVLLDVVLIWAGIVGNPWLSIQAGEYAEAPMICDLLIVVAAVMVIASLHTTVWLRRRPRLYVSVWYLLGGLYTTAITYLVGNFLVLLYHGEAYQVIESWWLHNAVGLIITPLGLGVTYYLVPKAAQRPLYSHRLSILGFWSLMAFYPGTGLHHFLQMPTPVWINEFAVVSSVLLAIPVLAVVTNFWATPADNWGRVVNSYPLRFTALGTFYYLTTCIQGPFQATNAVNWYVHFTEWVQAHAHLALAGAFSCYAMAAGFYLVPRLYGRQFTSRVVASWIFWMMAVFFPLFYIGFTWAGVATGASVNLLGNTIYETLVVTWVPRLSRTVMGCFVLLGYLLFVYAVIAAIRRGAPWHPGMEEIPPPRPYARHGEAGQEVPA